MSLMPTWLIGIWRVSARFCTSSTETTWAFGATAGFMARTVCGLSPFNQPLERGRTGFLRPRPAVFRALCSRQRLATRQRGPPAFHRGAEACGVELRLHQAILARTVLD